SLDQKNNTSSLVLGLSGAALAFSVSLLSSRQTYIGSLETTLFHLHATIQLGSIVAAVAFSINRTRDFGLTARIAHLRERNPDEPNLGLMRNKVRRRGRLTRRLYRSQLILFT